MKCPNCGVSLMGGMYICPKCKYDTRTADGGESFRYFQEHGATEYAEKAMRREENREASRKNMILTTCPRVEGYSVVRQCGLVFGEVVFKTNFLKSLGANIENKFNSVLSDISFSDKELSGTTRLISNAREYALTKMKDEAINRDANAIIGIQTASTIGGEILHITISGTAVEINKSIE